MMGDPALPSVVAGRSVAPAPMRVLVAEDESHLGTVLEQYLLARGFTVTMVRNGRLALEHLRAEPCDVALLDIVMPDLDGLEVLRQVREEPLPPEIIMMSGNSSAETSQTAMRLGAYDLLSKPYRLAEVDALVRRAVEKRRLVRENRILRVAADGWAPTLASAYPPLLAALARAVQQFADGMPLLITGEPGTGKAHLARVIHAHQESGHQAVPCVPLSCAGRSAEACAQTLFGAEGDGADAHAPGVLEVAAGGTVILTHIDQLELSVQDRLLRAVQDGRFPRVGGYQSRPFHARIIATSTRDLARQVASGAFREPLYRWLSGGIVAVPPLRERLGDVAALARQMLAGSAAAAGARTGAGPGAGPSTPLGLADEALLALQRYRWPGNVAELQAVLSRAALLSVGGVIRSEDLALQPVAGGDATALSLGVLTLDELEQRHIVETLQRVRWHQGQAAELLGISAKTLYRKIRTFGLQRPGSVS